MTINNKNIDSVFYIFVTAHLIFWILIPSFTNHNLPLDTIEALAWGSNLDWGFNKHPPMSAFVPEIFFSNFWITRLGVLFIKPNICFNCFLFCI